MAVRDLGRRLDELSKRIGTRIPMSDSEFDDRVDAVRERLVKLGQWPKEDGSCAPNPALRDVSTDELRRQLYPWLLEQERALGLPVDKQEVQS